MPARLIAVLLGLTAVAEARSAPTLDLALKGQRAKLDCRVLPGNRLVASSVTRIAADDGFAIEGLVAKIDRRAGTFRLGPFTVNLTDKTKFENSRREVAGREGLVRGKRVKVKAREIEGYRVIARTVRFYDVSGDTDLEIEAPVESVDVRRSEIRVLSLPVRIRSRTQYVNSESDLAETGTGQYIRRDDDAQHPDPLRLGRAYVGGNASFTHERTREHDLQPDARDAADWLTPTVELEVSAPLGEHSEAYTRINFNRRMYAGEVPGERGRPDFNVREAFLYVGSFLHPTLGLQIGRQRFRDRREWLYDDQLDAVRLHFAKSNLKVELSAAKGLVGPTGSRSDQYHFIAWSQYQLPGRRYLSGYLMKRDDLTPRDEDPVWYGLASRGPVIRNLDYWIELSRMKGRRGPNLLRGWASDAGAGYRLPLRLSPTLSAGYAFGSGDANTNDGVDSNFRQTSLNDNTSRFNGLKRYHYYGILTQPDLTNLRIATADLGLRPSDAWSVNFSFHNYRQAVSVRRLGEMEITLRPNGRHPVLGREFDAVFAVRKLRYTDLNFYFGVFLPGPGFSGPRPPAFFFRQELRYYF